MKLKRCPFCGSKAELRITSSYFEVRCVLPDCEAMIWANDKWYAHKCWNRRPKARSRVRKGKAK